MNEAHEPAYPSQRLDACGMPREDISYGLTKRELFAAMAMQGLLSGDNMIAGNPNESYISANSRHAVMLADRLLAELAKDDAA